MSQLRVWVRHCEKCGMRFTTISESHSIWNWYLCKTCCMVWQLFFERNNKRLQEKYPNYVNPTYDVFIGKLKEKEKVQFT